jgi:6-phosphofructokinase
MGYHAVQILADGKTNRIVTYMNDQCEDVDLDEGLAMKKGIDEATYAILDAVMGGV